MNTHLYNQFESDSVLHADGRRYTMSLGIVKNGTDSKATHSGFGTIRTRIVISEPAPPATDCQSLK